MYLRKNITNNIDKINYFLGRKIFNNFNSFTFNLFKYVYKKNICNSSYLQNDFVSKYHNSGFSKLDSVDNSKINNLITSLQKNNTEITPGKSFSYNYKIDKISMNLIKEIINSSLLEKLKILEKYYNLKIILSSVMVTRNYHISKNILEEKHSNFFHSDGYLFNLFKIFINLDDINEDKGPLTIVKKEKAKDFVKHYSYNTRKHCVITDETKNFFYKNIGNKGDIFLCNTTELFHKAGDVKEKEYRDILFLEFIAYPFDDKTHLYSFEKDFKNNSLTKKFSKIQGIRNLINLYSKCKNNKIY